MKSGAGRGMARRLSKYLRCAVSFREEGAAAVSSWMLGDYTGVNSAQVRRDLAAIGVTGTRGVGYETQGVIDSIQDQLGLAGVYEVALVGAGRLGAAIAESELIHRRGFRVTRIFDTDPEKVGGSLADVQVRSVEELLPDAEMPRIGIIAVPDEWAQEAAERLATAGVRAIINYTDVLLHVPRNVRVHEVDPSSQLMHTLYYLAAPEEIPEGLSRDGDGVPA